MVWLPNTINVEDVGMVFPYGTNKDNWTWAAVKAVKIPEEERKEKNHPIPGQEGKFLTYKMDMSTMENFSERNYVNAFRLYRNFRKITWFLDTKLLYLNK